MFTASQPVRKPGSRHGHRAKNYGTWDGQVRSIPGRVTQDNKPDMRDQKNIRKFLGERGRREQRRRANHNLTHGRGRNNGDDPNNREDEDMASRNHIDMRDLEDFAGDFRGMDDEQLVECAEVINKVEFELAQELKHRVLGDRGRRRDEEPRGGRREDQPRSSRRDDAEHRSRREEPGTDEPETRDRDRGSRRDDRDYSRRDDRGFDRGSRRNRID